VHASANFRSPAGQIIAKINPHRDSSVGEFTLKGLTEGYYELCMFNPRGLGGIVIDVEIEIGLMDTAWPPWKSPKEGIEEFENIVKNNGTTNETEDGAYLEQVCAIISK